MTPNARDLYLASLDPDAELSARRLAERSGLPDNDPIWLLLHELHRAASEITGSANAAIAHDAFAARLTSAVASSVVDDKRIIDAVANGIAAVHDASVRAIRSLESELRNVARKRAFAPISSLIFAFALALVVGFAAVWASYSVGSGYGYDLGYRSGYHDGIIYERTSK
ncbi:MAG: hypothetical protein KGN02_01410 [bacterium]|nr:hypothetical protein [bacterium]